MEKYFTPDISDIRVGYECEYYLGNSWHEHVVESLYTDRDGYGIFELEQYLQEGSLRVPYLTKEQIEAEGWELYSKGIDLWFKREVLTEEFDWSGICNFYGYKPYKLYLNYGLHDYKLKIKCDFSGGQDFNEADTLFEGECKDINTFRWICKLLKIN